MLLNIFLGSKKQNAGLDNKDCPMASVKDGRDSRRMSLARSGHCSIVTIL